MERRGEAKGHRWLDVAAFVAAFVLLIPVAMTIVRFLSTAYWEPSP